MNKEITVGIATPIPDNHPEVKDIYKVIKGILNEQIGDYIVKDSFIPSEKGDSTDYFRNIVSSIVNCNLLIVITSGSNANVALELGLRMGLGKPYVIVSNDADCISDLKTHNQVLYSSLSPTELESFKEKLKARIISELDYYDNHENSTFIDTNKIYKTENESLIESNTDINEVLSSLKADITSLNSKIEESELNSKNFTDARSFIIQKWLIENAGANPLDFHGF